MILYLMYIIYEASTFRQYTESFYFCSALLGTSFWYMIVLCRLDIVFELIDETEKYGSERKFGLEMLNGIKSWRIVLHDWTFN